MNLNEYCPNCRRRTEHIKIGSTKLCKRCGKQGRRLDPRKVLGY